MVGGTRHFRLRYVGPRFAGGRLPLDVLSDLPAFRDLVVAFAKDTWRRQHTRRKRVPKGFERSIVFDLVAIESNTAVPVMVFDREIAQAVLPGFSDSFDDLIDDSYLRLVQLFHDAGHDRFPVSLSSDHLRALNRFGSGLQNGDRIEFLDAPDSDDQVVYLDSHRRKAIITRLQETYETRYEGLGRLRVNNEEGRITVATIDHGDIDIAVGREAVLTIFDGNLGANVQFDLAVEMDQDDRFKAISSVYHVDIVDEEIVRDLERCRERLSYLRKMESGWLDGEGQAISRSAAENALTFLSKKPSFASIFDIYPTPDGGLLFEFESGGWDWSVECLSTGKFELYGVQLDGEEELGPLESDSMDEFLKEFEARVEEE